MVATSRANSSEFQNGALRTSVPTRNRSVACAAATSVGNGATTPRWSAANSVSYPSASMRRHRPANAPADSRVKTFVAKRNSFTSATVPYP